jgi:acyl-CoA hydrolase
MPLPPRISAFDAARMLKPGQRAYVGGCTAEPTDILDLVALEPEHWRDATLTGAFIPGVNDRDYSALGIGTRVETIFSTRGLQRPSGLVAHLPLHYSTFYERLARPGMVDVVYITVPLPAEDGTIGLGLATDFSPAPIGAGAQLVGVVNPAMADPPNGPRLPVERFTALVESDAPLPQYDAGAVDPATRMIAKNIVSLLRPGDHLQLGLGKVQRAVFEELAGSGIRGIGFHAGMISTPALPAIIDGIFGLGVTTGVVLGNHEFYRAVSSLRDVRFAPVGETHAQRVLAALPNFVSVNSVIEIDLSGQANAEALSGRQVSGQGGLVDFLRGARASSGGRAILALPSTTSDGDTSRIVPRLKAGTPVSVARADADIIVTEHGIARIAEMSLEERAAALAGIADPRHREALERAAREDSR